MLAERPHLDDPFLVASAQPEAHAVAGNRADDCPHEYPAKTQRAGAGQRAGEEHCGAARNERADDGNGFEEGRKKDDREHRCRMAGKQMQKVDVSVLHRA
jgi:hypothetical protein